MVITLTVNAEGKITLRKEVLDHLGVGPGDEVDIDVLPGRRLQLRRKCRASVASVSGMLARPGTPQLSIEQINEIAASGWADDD